MRTISPSLCLALLALSAALFLDTRIARAQSPYCRRVGAEARSHAYLLMSPSLTVQGLHLPRSGDDTGTGMFQGAGWQARASLSLSVLDVVRGAWVLDAAGSECRRHDARDRVERVLRQGAALGRLEALRVQLRFLEERRPHIEDLIARAEARRAAQLVTQHQLTTLRLRVGAIERRALEIRAEIERLEGEEEAPEGRLRAHLEDYERSSLALERERSDIRRLDPWRIAVRVGVVPVEPADWFGAVELSYNLGGIAQWVAEDEVLDARADELREASYELRHRIERFERILGASAGEQEEALALLDAQIALVDQQRGMLAELAEGSGEVLSSLAMVEMNGIELEAERRFRARLLAEHRALTGDDDER